MANTREQLLLKTFGGRIAKIRKEKGITQQELAEKLDMSVVAIAYIETGKRWPRIGTLDKLAKNLDANIIDFFRE